MENPSYVYPTHPPNYRRCVPGTPQRAFTLKDGDIEQIGFMPCGVRSWHPKDIADRFCPFCKWRDPDAARTS